MRRKYNQEEFSEYLFKRVPKPWVYMASGLLTIVLGLAVVATIFAFVLGKCSYLLPLSLAILTVSSRMTSDKLRAALISEFLHNKNHQ